MSTMEWPLPVVAARIPHAGQSVVAEADAAIRAAVATRFGLPGIESLTFTARLQPVRGTIQAQGTITARITQICVLTLEPFDSEVQVPLNLRFVADLDESDTLDPDLPDEIALEGGVLELGEAVVQTLSLALDPYPRAPGAMLPDSEGIGEPAGPFAALARKRPGDA